MSSRHQRPAGRADDDSAAVPFVVYVEGPRDRDILVSWARRLSPRLGRRLVEAAVILGGRRPARALAHLEELGREGAGARGLCVLDRDTGADPAPPPRDGLDLEIFTWRRRHIESYLLVPAAIARGLRVRGQRGALERVLRQELPDGDDEAAWLTLDAKRILDRKGLISRCLGRPVNPGHIARAMRPDELHPEVHGLLERIGVGLGVVCAESAVTVRPALAPR